jgi:hypothetical protein
METHELCFTYRANTNSEQARSRLVQISVPPIAQPRPCSLSPATVAVSPSSHSSVGRAPRRELCKWSVGCQGSRFPVKVVVRSTTACTDLMNCEAQHSKKHGEPPETMEVVQARHQTQEAAKAVHPRRSAWEGTRQRGLKESRITPT